MYLNRPVVRLAPDAMVFINGELFVPVGTPPSAAAAARESNFSGGTLEKSIYNSITQITINASIESTPNTCSIALADPRTGAVPWFLNDTIANFGPMAEVQVYMKGRFLSEGSPAYYPVFWGMVSTITKSYSSGIHTLQVDCVDMLRWWQVTYSNVSPSFVDSQHLPGISPQIWSSIYYNMTPHEIIMSLAQISWRNMFASFDDVATRGFSSQLKNNPDFTGNLEDILNYWRQRFSTLATRVRIVGLKDIKGSELKDDAVSGSSVRQSGGYPHRPNEGSQNTAQNVVAPFTLTPEQEQNLIDEISRYQPYEVIGVSGLVESSYRTRLEIAQEVSSLINFEFYQDVNGEIIFKPPLWNLDVRKNKPVSVIENTDVIEASISDSESEVRATRIDFFGSYFGPFGSQYENKYFQPRATVIDYNLAKQFGIRPMEKTSTLTRTKESCFIYGITEMDKANMRRFSSTMSIPLRPELRLGFPIYVPYQDAFHYIYGLTHTVDFSGMSARTSLSLVATRRRYRRKDLDPALNEGEVKPNDERQAVTKEFQTEERAPDDSVVETPRSSINNVREGEIPDQNTITDSNVQTDHAQLDQLGREQKDESLAVTKATVVGLWSDVNTNTDTTTETSRPIADEAGYEVYGGFKYGRGLKVTATGNITDEDITSEFFEDSEPRDAQNSKEDPPEDEQPISQKNPNEFDPTNPTNPVGRALRLEDLSPDSSTGGSS